MSRAEEIRAHAQRVGAKPSNRSEAGRTEQAARTVKPQTRTKPVGKTINLDPGLNKDLAQWQTNAAADLGLSRVTFQQTVDALLRELLSDSHLSERVQARVSNPLSAI